MLCVQILLLLRKEAAVEIASPNQSATTSIMSSADKVYLVTKQRKGHWTSTFRSRPQLPSLQAILLDVFAGKYYCIPGELKKLNLPYLLEKVILDEIQRRKNEPRDVEDLSLWFKKKL